MIKILILIYLLFFTLLRLVLNFFSEMILFIVYDGMR